MNAEYVVDVMLESFEKWDKAYKSYAELYLLHKKRHELYQQMGRAIAYERALAKAGVRKADVSHPIMGGQIGSTHNYKGDRPAKRCQNQWCNRAGKNQPVTNAVCSECGENLAEVRVPYSLSDLRKKERHIVGVELKNGQYVWFDELISPTPWLDLEGETPASERPQREAEKRGDKRR